MGRLNAVLDKEVDYGFTGGVRYKTNIGEYPNRLEDRDSQWMYGKHEFSATLGLIPNEQREAIISTFHVCKGRKHSFLFKDHNDFKIIDQDILVLSGTSDPIQLYKVYEFGQGYTIRPIQALKFCVLKDENGDNVPGSWDLLTGIFTPENVWTTGQYYIESAEFYVWVRFDDDFNDMTISNWSDNTAKLKLIEDPFDFLPENVPNSWDD